MARLTARALRGKHQHGRSRHHYLIGTKRVLHARQAFTGNTVLIVL